MSTLSYPNKTVSGDGTAEYVEGNTLPAAELQGDFNAIKTWANGNIDQTNLNASTQIANSMLVEIDGTKVSDHSDNATIAATVTTPGDSANLSSNLATNLEGELERLRYRIEANNQYRSSTGYYNSSGAFVGTAWTEPPIQGPNLLKNSGFELLSGSTGDPPDGWTEIGTLGTTAIEAAAFVITGGHKRSLAVTTNATNEGISQTIQGLRSSTKYLFAVKYIRTSGTLAFSTTGGLGTGDYQNPTVTDSSSGGVQVASMIVKSDASATDIVCRIEATSGTSDFNLVQAWFFELNDDFPNPIPDIPSQAASVSAEVTNVPATVASGTDWDTQWTDIPGLALTQYIPGHGYRLIYEVSVAWASVLNSQQFFFAFRLEQDDGSTSVVDGPYIEADDDVGLGETNGVSVLRMTHIVDNPTPGLTYTFTPQATAADSASGIGSAPRLHPLVVVTAQGTASAGSNSSIQTISRSRLRVERI